MAFSKVCVMAISIASLASCPASRVIAETILANGRIYTLNPKAPWVEAMVIRDGEIVFVGTTIDAKAHVTRGATTIDLKQHVVLPGLHDVHMHPLEANNPAAGTCLFDEPSSLRHIKQIMADCMGGQQGTDWITGWGFSLANLRSLKGNPADILEAAAPGVPVIIMEKTSHSEWANRTALKRAGVTRDTPDPVGGIIVHDKSGEPTGLLLDNAGDVILEQVYKPNEELLDLAYEGLVKKLQEFPAYGLTSIADARVYWTRDYHKVWQRAAAEDKLPVRVVLGLWAYPELDDRQIEQIGRLHSDEPKSLLRITQVKFYVDGLIANGTARMKAPYDPSVQLAGHPNGLNYFTSDRLSHYIAELEKFGFDAHIHAIGDLGVHEALDAIERAQIINGSRGKTRHRITHIETYDRADLGRFVKLGVIADFQVAGEWSAPDIFYDEAKPYIRERARNSIPLRQVYETGATVTLSSDYDVSDPNPFVGMANALTRAPENLPNVDAAIRAYTINAAYTLRQEKWTGSLQVGKRADLVVIDRDIFKIAPNAIAKTHPLLTMMDGRVTYRSRKF